MALADAESTTQASPGKAYPIQAQGPRVKGRFPAGRITAMGTAPRCPGSHRPPCHHSPPAPVTNSLYPFSFSETNPSLMHIVHSAVTTQVTHTLYTVLQLHKSPVYTLYSTKCCDYTSHTYTLYTVLQLQKSHTHTLHTVLQLHKSPVYTLYTVL